MFHVFCMPLLGSFSSFLRSTHFLSVKLIDDSVSGITLLANVLSSLYLSL